MLQIETLTPDTVREKHSVCNLPNATIHAIYGMFEAFCRRYIQTRSNSPPTLITLEAGIGAGKTTLLNRLKHLVSSDPATFGSLQPHEVAIVEEPVDLWREYGLLQKMYEGEISPLEFQLAALTSRFGGLAQHFQNPHLKLIISERSMWSDRHVFATTTFKSEDNTAWDAYEVAYKQLIGVVPPNMNVVHVSLNVEISEIERRIEQRGREEEQSINVDYLHKLEKAHTQWMATSTYPFETVDGNAPPHKVVEDVLQIIRRQIA